MTYLERALKDGHAQISGEGKTQRITYIAVNRTERYSDPEEQVRAEYWGELIYRYGYEPARIGVEVTVPDRTPSDRADLIVFHDDERKRPYAVIECKRDDITDAEFNQAVEQACGNGTWSKLRSSFVGVVAGRTRRFLDFSQKYGVLEREANIIADLPIQYGKPEEFKFHKSGPLDLQPVNKEELITVIKKCHQTLWGGGKLSPPAAFGELSKIIFVKIRDEKHPRRKGEPYVFQIKTNEPSRRLAERIRALYEKQKQKEPNVFTENIKIDDATLRTVISHLEGISLSETDLDTKGVAFEQFMDGFFKGDFGQYFTPREIIEFAVEMMEPKNDEFVLDPSCGSGGFLLYALDKIRRDAGEYWAEGTDQHFSHWHDFAQNRLFGLEINDEIARVAKMNMIIHDDGHTNIGRADALDRFDRIRDFTNNNGFEKNHFDLILTNPPFGAQISLSERPYLSDYDLGNQQSANGQSRPRKRQKTEILFLERIWQFLKPGTGRAAVVMPENILTNFSLQYVRDLILEKFQLLAVVSFPQTAFSHYGALVKSNIVFLRKRFEDETPDDNEATFMAMPKNIGYDAAGKKCENQLPEMLVHYRAFKDNPEPYTVPKMENPYVYATVRSQLVNEKRLNPDYFHPERILTIRSMKQKKNSLRVERLEDIVDFVREITTAEASPIYIGLANVQSHTGELVEPTETATGSCFKFKENDILFARLRPYLNKVYLAENTGVCSTEFHVIRIKTASNPDDEILPNYLASVLRSSLILAQTRHMMTGNTHPRLANDDVINLQIPIVKPSIQRAIVKEMIQSRDESRRLRDEAAKKLKEFNERFEAQLLGKMSK